MITRILPILLLLLLVPAFAIARVELRQLRQPLRRRLQWGAMLPALVLSIALCATAFHESYTPAADRWKGLLMTATLLVLVPQTLYALLLLLPARRNAWMRGMRLGICVVVFGVMLYGFTLGWRRITVVQTDVPVAGLPRAFDGYRLVHISDLHLGTLVGHEEVFLRLCDSIAALRPDLIVFTGDLVNYKPSELDTFHKLLPRLQARDGVVSVMGNHDYLSYFRWPSSADRIRAIEAVQTAQREAGYRLLLNEHLIVWRGADSLVVVGLENDGPPRFPALADLPKALDGIAPGSCCIYLQHDPSFWRRALLKQQRLAPLMLAGHTHAMQLLLFGWSPAAWFYPEWGGLYAEGKSRLFVSTGIGSVMMPFRLGAWPEIDLLVLKSEP